MAQILAPRYRLVSGGPLGPFVRQREDRSIRVSLDLLERLGFIEMGVLFIVVALWARTRPDSFRRTFRSHRSETYDQRVLRYLPSLLIVAGVAAITLGLVSLLSQ